MQCEQHHICEANQASRATRSLPMVYLSCQLGLRALRRPKKIHGEAALSAASPHLLLQQGKEPEEKTGAIMNEI